MRKHKKSVLSLLLLCAVTLVMTIAALRASVPPPPPTAQEQNDDDQMPVTAYGKPEPSDPEKRKIRRVRAARHNLKDKNIDASRFAITEGTQSGYGTFEVHAKPEPALPAAQSDLIVVAEVTDAEAFLSADKTSIYSEFTLSVGEVLGGASAGAVLPGASITAERGGGAVRFPSGRIVRRAFMGKPFPRTGRRYVFFLKRNQEGESFSILTAYELRGGRVFPLDGLDLRGRTVPQLAAHQRYAQMDEAAFLTAVREAIAQTSVAPGGGE
ncbi:MAG TPA: hypothetical protein VF544_13780 [Pyrinomonadaceae bacterium]|jgi:hypothetical protein